MRAQATGTRFVLVRHAQSEWNAAGRWQGQADPSLSEHGIAQAEALARKLAGEPRADRLLCSDLLRAQQTARILGRALGLEAEPDPRLRELDVGTWSGLRREEIEARDPDALARFQAGDLELRAGGGESRREIHARVLPSFVSLAEEHAGAELLVVTHLGVVRALVAVELGHAEALRVTPADFKPHPESG